MPPRWKFLSDFNPLQLDSIPNTFLNQGRVVPAILLRHGYKFSYGSECTTISGPGLPPFKLSFGFYNLWFLMHWVEWSLDKPYSECIDWYAAIDDWEDRGKGFEWYSHEGSWIPHIGRSVFDRNYWDFSSVFAYNGPPIEMRKETCVGLSVACDFNHDAIPKETGLWHRKFDKDNLETRRAWQEVLSTDFARYVSSETAEIHFSNAANICMGYPPTADMLNLPKFKLDKFEADGTNWLDQADSNDLVDPHEYDDSCGPDSDAQEDDDGDFDEVPSLSGSVSRLSLEDGFGNTENEECDSQ